MSDVIKSIFRQREIEKIYEIDQYSGDIHYLYEKCRVNVRMNVKKEYGQYNFW